MFDTVCTLPLTSDIFSQSLHPNEPILSVGLSSGHVQVFRLPAIGDDEDERDLKGGVGKVVTQWRTRRHKGSCRSVAFSLDGEVLYSAGTDGILKAASSSTGQVTAKIAIPTDPPKSALGIPSLVHTLSSQTLLVATDSAALHVYDLRTGSAPFSRNQKPQQTYHPHDDYVSSISPLPPSESSSSGTSKQWVTTGATTLAVTDLRRGVLAKSEDQEEELLSSSVVSGVPAKHSRKSGEKVIVGGAGGVLTLWNRGFWDDQDDRIVLDKAVGGGESLDAITNLPDDIEQLPEKSLAVGMGNGRVKIVGLYPNKVVGELLHDDIEGVVALGVDSGGRLISAGGQTVKIWTPREIGPEEERAKNGVGRRKRAEQSEGDESDSDEAADDNDDEPEQMKKRKRRRKGKRGKPNGGKGVLGFGGLD